MRRRWRRWRCCTAWPSTWRGGWRQGLTLVHFSAQPKPYWSHLPMSLCIIDWGEIMHPTYPTKCSYVKRKSGRVWAPSWRRRSAGDRSSRSTSRRPRSRWATRRRARQSGVTPCWRRRPITSTVYSPSGPRRGAGTVAAAVVLMGVHPGTPGTPDTPGTLGRPGTRALSTGGRRPTRCWRRNTLALLARTPPC